MYVVKRNGTKEPVHFDKITSRIKKLAWGLSDAVDPIEIAKKVCVNNIYYIRIYFYINCFLIFLRYVVVYILG